jgi:NAD(P)H-flavin reductase
VKDLEIEQYAHELANTLPELPPEADRPRGRFVVERVWAEGSRYKGVSVRIDDPDFVESFTRPGQYLTFQYGAIEPRFLVIASPPQSSSPETGPQEPSPQKTGETDLWEFLIDLDSDLGEAVTDLRAGQSVLLSPAEGSGYPAEALGGRSALIFTTGAGIASVRPVMQFWRARPDTAPSCLAVYYGEADSDQFAYVGEFADWRAGGAHIFQAIENLPKPTEGYRYVQHAFDAHEPELEDAVIFVSGAPVMMELIIAKLMAMGVHKEQIFINV